ncbi:MAG: SDR family NAD(P)-dependent oxidoreductase [Sphingomonadaceae bacterium]
MTPALFDLHGKVVLLTGACGGLGRAMAAALAAQGATLLLTDHDAVACATLAAQLDASALPCDLAQADQVQQLAELALTRHGRVDVLICNAGVQGPAGASAAVSAQQWDSVMDINLRSAALLTAGLIPAMAAHGGGSVILLSSIAGLRGNGAIGLYGLSKAALAQMARNLAVEWGPHNVRVNAISPGLIRTPLAAGLLADPTFMARRMAHTPLRRPGEAHEIAGVAVMLASAAGAFISGQNLVVDGGTTISDGS